MSQRYYDDDDYDEFFLEHFQQKFSNFQGTSSSNVDSVRNEVERMNLNENDNIRGTTKKHRAFSGEPMRDKPVEDLAGIGVTSAGKLKEQGFHKAYNVLGQFLLLNMDQDKFCNWLKETANVNKKRSKECHACLKAWCDEFL